MDELQYNEMESELRRLIIRLSFGINEYDDQLINLLSELRNDFRNTQNSDEIRHYHEQVGRLLSQVNEPGGARLLELPLKSFNKLLSSDKLKMAQRDELKTLAEKVIHEKGTLDTSIWKQFIQLLDKSMYDNLENTMSGSPADHEQLLAMLDGFIQSLGLDDEEEKPFITIRQSLYDEFEQNEIEGLFSRFIEMTGLYLSGITQRQHATESFLQDLKNNLTTMQSLVNGLMLNQNETAKQSDDFKRTLSSNISLMNDKIEGSADIEQLKDNIRNSISTISTTLESYHSGISQKQEQMTQKMDQVYARMNAMEIVSEILKKRLVNEQHRAMHDDLTGLPNRKAYDERMSDEMERYTRYKTPFVLSVWDIDHFKQINDTYGHQAGDNILKSVADVLRKNLRRVDFVARYGGEEFVVIMSNSSTEGALQAANKIRQMIAATHFHYNGESVEVTISSGLAVISSDDTTNSLFKRADDALYQAKNGGRNCCEVGVEIQGSEPF
ncbi:MAG: GGDEF domain-containing protein [Gammaproteobacteria bacterium]|nr:GGDEF domain-containing protein [Gammaproteobacteria bacterium]